MYMCLYYAYFRVTSPLTLPLLLRDEDVGVMLIYDLILGVSERELPIASAVVVN